jgi:hypothetical protein
VLRPCLSNTSTATTSINSPTQAQPAHQDQVQPLLYPVKGQVPEFYRSSRSNTQSILQPTAPTSFWIASTEPHRSTSQTKLFPARQRISNTIASLARRLWGECKPHYQTSVAAPTPQATQVEPGGRQPPPHPGNWAGCPRPTIAVRRVPQIDRQSQDPQAPVGGHPRPHHSRAFIRARATTLSTTSGALARHFHGGSGDRRTCRGGGVRKPPKKRPVQGKVSKPTTHDGGVRKPL